VEPGDVSECPADDVRREPEPAPGAVTWTPEAETRLRRAPVFLRGMVRRLAERRARAEGRTVITPELMTRYKQEMMGPAMGPAGAPPALSWTPEAEELLAGIPEFMRPITRRICEELAAEQGLPRITAALIREAEALAEAEAVAEPLPWTAEAEAMLLARLGRTPSMMADFVLRLFKRDVELEARRRGEPAITAEVYHALDLDAAVAARRSPGGTAPERVREAIKEARRLYLEGGDK